MFRLFLIRLGKVIGIIKSEGMLSGLSRTFANGMKYLGMLVGVGSGDILFVAGGVLGDSALYRVHHQREELELQGFKCSATVQDNPLILNYADRFKIFIFQRVSYSGKIPELISLLEKKGKEIIFEADDLIFDPKYFRRRDYFVKANALEKKLYEKGVGEELLNNSYVKVCVTTTSYLADKLKEYGKRVFISSNKLSTEDLRIVKKIEKRGKTQIPTSKPQISLGYFSGTISHNKDFATINQALMEIMKKYPNVELCLVGPLEIENELNEFSSRIKKLSRVPRRKHFENIANIDINLSPLEIGNPFCKSKSELKFFEAGILGIPTVASATQTFKEAISDGIDGFVASDTGEWISKLSRLILEPELRSRMGLEARKKALERYTTSNAKNEEYYNYLRSKI